MTSIPAQTYLVGGAVRDRLLGDEVTERDWVVVGSSPEQMHELGFRPVGKAFPVFLHPESGEEYALARTERKTGHGYHGFTFFTDPEVSLEEDLARRDLTINAIAMARDDTLVDPFGGVDDLRARKLRHVSPAFTEDPLRVLRVARFAARFHSRGFALADETLALARRVAISGELSFLSPERIWQETSKALATDAPQVYFRLLRRIGALGQILPELNALFGVPQPPGHHPEVDTGIHSLMALEQASRLSRSPHCRFAALVHDLGKALTPESDWPRHIGHEALGVKPIEHLTRRLGASKEYSRLATLVSRWHLHCHRAEQLKPKTLLKLFDALDLWRRPQTLDDFLVCCEADARGRTGLEERTYPAADYLREAFRKLASIKPAEIASNRNLSGEALGRAIREARLEVLAQFRG